MIDGPFQSEPTRLIDEDGEAGELLRSVDRAYADDSGESGAWRRLEARHRRRTTRSWVLAAAATALLVGGLGTYFRHSQGGGPELATVEPEPSHQAPEPAEPKPTLSTDVSELPAPVAPRPVRTLTPVQPPQEGQNEAGCNRWLRDGNPERAIECFRGLSQRSGLEAEVALYKAAELIAGKLGDPARALPLLEEHRQRFPEGAMRGEVAWLRVQSLSAAGRFDEALAASEALLATPAGRTLSNDLHMLRGRIYQDNRGDCSRAASEFVALVGDPGPLGDEAELRRAECLEKLNRLSDAQAAYRQYLRRSKIGNEAKARDRLRALEVGGFRPEGRAP